MSAVISGQAVTVAKGTAVPLTSLSLWGEFEIRALDTNTGTVAIGDDGTGDVTVDNGHRLTAGQVAIVSTGNLAQIYLDSTVDGEGVSWLKISS